MRHIILLGSTGSIGTQTLDVIRKKPQIGCVKALAAGGHRLDLLEEQVREFHPQLVAVYEEKACMELKRRLSDRKIEVVCGMEGLKQAVSMEGNSPSMEGNSPSTEGNTPSIEGSSSADTDVVVTAMVGMIGLEPTVEAIRHRKTIALANKETLVCAGAYIMKLAKEYGVDILPVDSEHSAIFQSLYGRDPKTIGRILLTASGGPFRGWKKEALEKVTVEQALKHPNWSMGAKITIDSATMMNKGLEMIEARWLFDVEADQIQVLVHPQSVLHSAVEYVNGSVIAQMGVPDMRLPIQEALEYPNRTERIVNRLDLVKYGALTFEEPDETVFRSIPMARYALKKGGLFPAVYNAANEKAVAAFLRKEIGFCEIFHKVEAAMERYDAKGCHRQEYTIEDILALGELVQE